jgi:hypothetical protein
VDAGIAHPEAFILSGNGDEEAPTIVPEDHGRPSIVVGLFRKYVSGSKEFKQTAVKEVFPGTPIIRLTGATIDEEDSHFVRSQVDAVRRLDLDFIWGIHLNNISNALASATKYGVWFFRHDLQEKRGHGAPFFHEIMAGEDTVHIVMEKIGGENEEPVPLREGCLKIVKHSYKKTIDDIYGQCSKWPLWVCQSILAHGVCHTTHARLSTELRQSESPSTLQLLLFPFRLLSRLIRDKYHSLFRHFQWNIGIMEIPISQLLQEGAPRDVRYLDLSLGREKFRADPFALWRENRLTILFEEFDYTRDKGIISYMNLSEGNPRPDSHVVFDMPFHMSYPYLFTHEDEIFCVPETAGDRRIRLYRALQFPETWAPVADLVEGVAAIDPTVFRHQQRWWVAFTDLDYDPNLNLFLWYADDLEGPWRPHTCNPVKTDVRSARPAGTPFMHDGNLYRPSQDSSKGYGTRTVINRVTKLTPYEFEEEPAAIVAPPQGGDFPSGLHTLCAAEDITVIDSCRVIFVGAEFKRVFRERIRKTHAALRRSLCKGRN